MAFIPDIPDAEATGKVRALYDADLKTLGYVAGYTKLLAHRPDVQAAWTALIGAIRAGMDLRRYELVTLAAARRLRCSY
jgi:hypothetical protein